MRAAGLANPRVYFYTALVRPWGNDVSDFAIRPQDVVAVGIGRRAMGWGTGDGHAASGNTKGAIVARANDKRL